MADKNIDVDKLTVGYQLLHWLAWFLFKLVFFFKVQGHENIPCSGGVLIVANHASYLDPVIIGNALRRRPVYLARASLFRRPIFARILTAFHAIPIKGLGINAFKQLISLLNAGRVCVIFPEGTRSYDGNLQPAMSGIGSLIMLARNNNINFKIVPVRIFGSFSAWPRQHRLLRLFVPIRVHFGKPITFNDLPNESKKIPQFIMNLINKID